MDYELTVTRSVPNPHYDEQLEQWKTKLRERVELDRFSNSYGGSIDALAPAPTVVSRVLTVTLSEDEFAAVKRAVLETFE